MCRQEAPSGVRYQREGKLLAGSDGEDVRVVLLCSDESEAISTDASRKKDLYTVINLP